MQVIKIKVLFAMIVFAAAFAAMLTIFTGPAFSETEEETAEQTEEVAEENTEDSGWNNKNQGFVVHPFPEIVAMGDIGYGGGAGCDFLIYRELPPYFMKILAEFNISSLLRQKYLIRIDFPQLLEYKIRLRSYFMFTRYLNCYYHGIGNNTIFDFTREDDEYYPGSPGTAGRLSTTQYHKFIRNRFETRIQPEYLLSRFNLWKGTVQIRGLFMFGYAYTKNVFKSGDHDEDVETPAEDLTLLELDKILNDEKVTGEDGGNTGFYGAGIVWDSRDIENNPTRGTFSDIIFTYYNIAAGSDWNFPRLSITDRRFFGIFPWLIYAQRVFFQASMGKYEDIPFYEMSQLIYSERDAEGMGGVWSLRGYRQNRFIDRVLFFANFELRFIVYKMRFLQGPLEFMPFAFADIGRVASTFADLFKKDYWHPDYGVGLRVLWNIDSILNLHFAFAQERLDYQEKKFIWNFALEMGHQF